RHSTAERYVEAIQSYKQSLEILRRSQVEGKLHRAEEAQVVAEAEEAELQRLAEERRKNEEAEWQQLEERRKNEEAERQQLEERRKSEEISRKLSQHREWAGEFVWVGGGTFSMGCTSEQGGDCLNHEYPVHQVTISDFIMGKYEVTQAQWRAVMGSDPRKLKFD